LTVEYSPKNLTKHWMEVISNEKNTIEKRTTG